MHVLLNLQGLHSTSHFLLVILLACWYNLSAKLWLLWFSILQAPHIHLRPAALLPAFVLQREGSNSKKNGGLPHHNRKIGIFLLATGVPSGFSVQFCSIDTYMINDQNEGGKHTTHKFAADNRLGGAVDSSEE